MNSFARLSQPMLKVLLDQAESHRQRPLMTMIINIPERVLLTKVSKMSDPLGEHLRIYACVPRHHRSREP